MAAKPKTGRFYGGFDIASDEKQHITAAAEKIKKLILDANPNLAKHVSVAEIHNLHLTLVAPKNLPLDEIEDWFQRIKSASDKFRDSEKTPWEIDVQPLFTVTFDDKGNCRTVRLALGKNVVIHKMREVLYPDFHGTQYDSSSNERLSMHGHMTMLQFEKITSKDSSCILDALGMSMIGSNTNDGGDRDAEHKALSISSSSSSSSTHTAHKASTSIALECPKSLERLRLTKVVLFESTFDKDGNKRYIEAKSATLE